MGSSHYLCFDVGHVRHQKGHRARFLWGRQGRKQIVIGLRDGHTGCCHGK